jgi:hypothetical protein
MAAIKGKKLSAEHKAKIAEGKKGKSHSILTKLRMSESAKARAEREMHEMQSTVLVGIIEALPARTQENIWMYCPQEVYLDLIRMCYLRLPQPESWGWSEIIRMIQGSHRLEHLPPELQALIARSTAEQADPNFGDDQPSPLTDLLNKHGIEVFEKGMS